MGVSRFNIKTHSRTELIDITGEVSQIVSSSGIKEGICLIYIPHTTAGVTINENADPSVKSDILKELNKIIPFSDGYAHMEGNSAAHIKSTIVGVSLPIPISDGHLVFGTWQGIFFCEFDGPRTRSVIVQTIGS